MIDYQEDNGQGFKESETSIDSMSEEQEKDEEERSMDQSSCTQPKSQFRSMEELTTNFSSVFKDDVLRGKTALVTGGGSGIGFTLAEYLIRHGCKVAIASRNMNRIQQAAKQMNGISANSCVPIQMDVRNTLSVESAVSEAMRQFRKIDILVNCAAGNFLCSLDSMSFNAFKTVLEIDTQGTFNVSKTVYSKSMKANGGVIVHISASLYYRGIPMQAHAGAAKAAIDALTRHMAVEWGPLGIRVVGICPGPINDTEGMRKLGNGMEEEVKALIPLGRLGERQDIANALVFLVSPAASYIHGQTVVVDGGDWMTCSMPFQMFAKL